MNRSNNTALIRINSDTPCKVMYFGREITTVGVSDYSKIYLPKGRHRLSFVSQENPKDQVTFEKEILDVEYEDIIDVELRPVSEARQKKEQAEEERICSELAAVFIEEERVRQDRIRQEQERIKQEYERRLLQEASSPYKIRPFSKLNFYDSVEIKRFGFYEIKEYFLAKKNEKYSILNENDFLPLFPFFYSSIKQCHGSGNRIWLEQDKKWGLYNLTCRSFIINPSYDHIEISDNMRDTIVKVAIGDWFHNNAKYGLIDDSGTSVADCIYSSITDVHCHPKLNT